MARSLSYSTGAGGSSPCRRLGGMIGAAVGQSARSPTADDPVHLAGSGGIVRRGELFERLAGAGRVTVVSAPVGSGKTFLLRSWIGEAGLSDSTAWVSAGRDEQDPGCFWISVQAALRSTPAGLGLIREVTPAPGLGTEAIVESLLEDLGKLEDQLWLVIDDAHQLEAGDTLRELALFAMRAPARLRLVVLTRRDLRLGLHRLRLEGELTEIRAEDLRFSLDETRALFAMAGSPIPDSALALLRERTEGWAAGLRLAALTLTGHDDPEQFAAKFSGSERAVADYLVEEVLDRLPEHVRQLLLRTSLLARVNGPLADLLSGGTGGERVLQDLERANAFVVSLDARRSWFRYHQLFAELLALELRRTAPQELPGLHTIAAEWLAEHGHTVEAIRHAQTAENWGIAARLLADDWRSMHLDGRIATARELLSRFPAAIVAADPELAVLAASDRRMAGSLNEAESYLALAQRESGSVPAERRGRFQVSLASGRLAFAQARNDPQAVADEAERLLARTKASESIEFGLGDDLRTSVLTDLGIAETWAGRLEDAERHLEQGLEEARRIGRPMLELQALGSCALLSAFRSLETTEQSARQAIELARAHGWEETTSAAATAYVALAGATLWRGRLAEAEGWLDRAERVLGDVTQPTAVMMLHASRALLESARGRYATAAAAYRDAERIEGLLVMPSVFATRTQALKLETLVQLGETERVVRALADMDEEVRETTQMRVVLAALRLADADPEAAVAVLAPSVVSTPVEGSAWEIKALLLEAIARDALRDPGAVSRALEAALDRAESGGLLLPFLLHPAPSLLERHLRLRSTHAALISEILNLLSGHAPGARPSDAAPLPEPLSESELRVLRYLPTNLSAPEIAGELYLGVSTVKTHIHHVYAKLGVHRRAEAVERARALGLLAPSARTRR